MSLFKRETERHARVIRMEETDRINPNQYLTKNGVVCPGSSGRFHVDFTLEDGSVTQISVSAKEAGQFAIGMKGTLVHRGDVLVSFEPDNE